MRTIKLETIIATSCTANSITGKVDDLDVELTRGLDGWTPCIFVSINGIRMDTRTATSELIAAWHKLQGEAGNRMSDNRDRARLDIMASSGFKKLFDIQKA